MQGVTGGTPHPFLNRCRGSDAGFRKSGPNQKYHEVRELRLRLKTLPNSLPFYWTAKPLGATAGKSELWQQHFGKPWTSAFSAAVSDRDRRLHPHHSIFFHERSRRRRLGIRHQHRRVSPSAH